MVVLVAAAALLLVVEVQLARGGPRLAERELRYPGAATGAGARAVAWWLGDSTAVGVGADHGDDSVAGVLAARTGEGVVMLARPGARVADVVEHQLPEVAPGPGPRRVYVSVGANDVTHLTGRSEFRQRYRRLLDGLADRLEPGTPVVVLGVPDIGSVPRFLQPLRALAGLRGRQLDAVIRDEAATRPGLRFVDIAATTGPAFRRQPGLLFAEDRYHPSSAGYKLWAEAVIGAEGRRERP